MLPKLDAEVPLPPTGCDEIGRIVREMRSARPERPGCPISAVRKRLRDSGLRPTRQRVLLAWMLFAKGHRHVSTEQLFNEAAQARAMLSLATVYNTLHQFTDAGLLRQVHAGAGKAYFDTNTSDHHHYLVEGEEEVFDVEDAPLELAAMPKAPAGFAIAGVDVIVRLRRLGPARGGQPS